MSVHQKVNLTEQRSHSSEEYENILAPQTEKRYKCLDCGAGFSFLWSLKKHMMIHTGEKPHECPYCSRTFRILQTLKCHMMTHTGEKPYKCLHCSKRFIQVGARKVHMMTHTGEKPHVCSDCGKGFITAASLKLHTMRRHQVDKPYTCSHCPDTFGTPSSLKRHVISHADKNKGKEKTSSPLKPMYNNEKLPAVEAVIIEDIKDEEISSQSKTIDHKPHTSSTDNRRHPYIEALKNKKKICILEKSYTCSYCSKAFKAAAGLRTHIMTHTGEKPYMCSDCGKRFTTSGNLRAHLRTHTGEKPYPCTQCEKTFIQTTNLMLHMTNHHGAEKPQKCPHCPQTFVTPKVHLICHADKEKYDHKEMSPVQTKNDKDKGTSCESTSSVPTDAPHPYTEHEVDNHPEPVVRSNVLGGTRAEYVVHKPYKCPSCFKAFRQPSGLKAHMQACHRVEKPYTCSHCPKSFHGPSYLKVHEMTHKGEKSHACPHCPSTFGKQSDLELHMLTHTGKKSANKLDKDPPKRLYRCPDCKRGFSLKHNLKRHQTIHTGDRPHQCPYCSKTFRLSTVLKSHMMTHTGEKPHMCSHCGQGFTQRSSLIKHLQVHKKATHSTISHPSKRLYKCFVCYSGFSYKYNMKRHKQTIHTGKQLHECLQCSKIFRLSADLKSHMMTHTEEKCHVCSHCGEGFTQISRLEKHLQTHQKEPAICTVEVTPKKLYRCPVCQRGFSFQHYLNRHLTIHTGKNPHQCPHCFKRFRVSADLESHMMTHKGGKNHVCSHCGQGFDQISRLKKHLQFHKKATASCTVSVQPMSLYKCSVCKIGFSSKHNLKRHQRIHTGQKPYQCIYCYKTFRLSTDLKSHMMTHTGEKHLQTHQKAGTTKQAFKGFSGLKNIKDTNKQDLHDTSKPELTHRACMQSDTVTPNVSGKDLHILDDVPTVYSSPTEETLQIDQKPHKCSECDAAFRYQSVLKKHTMTHAGKRPYQCSVCDGDFKTCATLQKHMVIHKGERPYKCCHCSKTFRSSNTMRYHVMIHTGEKPQECSYCGQRFIQRNSLKWHLRTRHKGEEARTCSGTKLSGKSLSTNSDKPEAPKNRDMRKVSKSFKSKRSHIEQNRPETELCEKAKTTGCYEGGSNLQLREVPMISKAVEDPHTCSICGAVSISAYKLTLHLHTHMDKESEAKHIRAQSSPAVSAVRKQRKEKQLNTCSECGWSFRNKTDYRKHQMVHLGVKSYKCSHCLKTFRKSSTLKTHAMRHTGERPHLCSYCGKGFIQTSSLKSHLRSHHNDKHGFKCSESEKDSDYSFASQSHKDSHNKDKLYRKESISEKIKEINSEMNKESHHRNGNAHETSKRPEHIETVSDQNLVKTDPITRRMKGACECSVCGKVLSTVSNLAVHRRIHTGEKPYQCAVCNKTLRTYSAALCHTRSHTMKGALLSAHPRDLMKKLAHPHTIQKNVKSCSKCDEVLKDSVDLKFHAAVHKAENYSRCSVCVQGFDLPKKLENHVFICHRSFILC